MVNALICIFMNAIRDFITPDIKSQIAESAKHGPYLRETHIHTLLTKNSQFSLSSPAHFMLLYNLTIYEWQ
jgi:hypothetical protein